MEEKFVLLENLNAWSAFWAICAQVSNQQNN